MDNWKCGKDIAIRKSVKRKTGFNKEICYIDNGKEVIYLTETILMAMGGVVLILLIIIAKNSRQKGDDAALRIELTAQFNMLSKTLLHTVGNASASSTASVEILRGVIEEKLTEIQYSVDRKLDDTLRTGLDSSFRRVSEQLQEVYKSMGEVRTLTNGIVDLKNILSNVKTRGIWGEVQLHKLLLDFMARGQYVENARIEGDNVVEFAIKVPREGEEAMLLPIDSKFPMDRYARVIKEAERGNSAELVQAQKELVTAILQEAKKISEKYIQPPKTTDFAILFLPSEGLYTEIIRLGLLEKVQTNWRVMIAGPSTLSALLTSFQTGFKAVAIKKHSAAILDMLNAVRVEFESFAMAIQRTQNSLATAQNHLETVQKRSHKIQNRLTDVHELSEN